MGYKKGDHVPYGVGGRYRLERGKRVLVEPSTEMQLEDEDQAPATPEPASNPLLDALPESGPEGDYDLTD